MSFAWNMHAQTGIPIPLLAEEGWRDSLTEAGAPGAKREPDRARPQLMVSSAENVADLTTRLRLRFARRIQPSSARRGIPRASNRAREQNQNSEISHSFRGGRDRTAVCLHNRRSRPLSIRRERGMP